MFPVVQIGVLQQAQVSYLIPDLYLQKNTSFVKADETSAFCGDMFMARWWMTNHAELLSHIDMSWAHC